MPARSSKKITVKFSVNEAIGKSLRALPKELQLKVLRLVVKRQGKRMIDNARPRIPVGGARTGRKADKKHLRDTLEVGPVKWATPDVLYVVAGPGWPAGAHGHLVEFGRTKKGPPMRITPFLRPAADATESANMEDMKRTAARYLTRYYRSIPKRMAKQ